MSFCKSFQHIEIAVKLMLACGGMIVAARQARVSKSASVI